MTSRRNRRPITSQDRFMMQLDAQRRLYLTRFQMGNVIARARQRAVWFRPPTPKVQISAARIDINQVDLAEYARRFQFSAERPAGADKDTEHWADALLVAPTSSLNHRTARIAGKPYHWRQRHYTGQLYLAAGDAPW